MRNRVAVLVVTVMLMGCLDFRPVEAGTPPPVEPLVPVSADPIDEITSAPVVVETSGMRQQGIVTIAAEVDFQSGALRSLHPGVELIKENANPITGRKLLTVRVPDHDIDQFIADLDVTPGIRSSAKSHLIPLQTQDPYWPVQQLKGLDSWTFKATGICSGSGVPTYELWSSIVA